MRIFKWMFWLGALAALVWFAATVPLGSRTLLGHLVAIARTKEAKELAEGTKQEAKKVAERIREELRTDGGAAHQKPLEKLDDDDRKGLRDLVKEKSAK